jgi:uncharacterized membrane protein
MAEPGDQEPKTNRPVEDPDLHVGFVTPYSLAGQSRSTPEPEPEPESQIAEAAPEPEPAPTPAEPPVAAEPALTPPPAAPEPSPVSPRAEPRRADPPVTAPPPYRQTVPPPHTRPASQPAPLGLYAVYALILFAVPTLGVSALIALLAVTGREAPADPLARSHFIYQQRTLWAGAVAALLGVILIVINVGVFVLFVLALWLIARGAWGVMRLKASQPLNNPRGWLF